jgi:ribosomal protein S18 acetylase RimI-like enzyme
MTISDAAGRSVAIARERPDTADASALVLELEDHLAVRYPVESRHGFSVERLVRDGVAFYVARVDGAPAGCGGLLEVPFPAGDDVAYGEVKRMYVRPGFRGCGIGRAVLGRLIGHAREAGFEVVRLETGIDQVEAISLYESAGFRRRAPFGPYRDDPLSPCYELRST